MADLLSFNIGLNLDRKPAVGFNFVLRVEALYDLPCKSVRSFSKVNEYEYVQEGGVNDYVHMLRKPISQPFTFQVERYVGVNLLDPLTNGTDLVLPVILMVNRTYGGSQTVRYYVFTGCTVTGKEFGSLDSEKSELLTETTTIAYREMFCIDNPLAGLVTGETWSFDGTSKKGSGKQSAVHIDDAVKGGLELDQSAMQAKAKKWMFTGGNTAKTVQSESTTGSSQTASASSTGNSGSSQTAGKAYLGINRSAVTTTESSREDMEEKAKKWPPTVSAVTSSGELRQEDMEKRAKKWPPTASVVTSVEELGQEDMEKKARRWPKEKSAASIASYLSNNDRKGEKI
ncbi:MAG: phage tail protein [Lachnospiraceae bacterium]|nr:phage tail protein [Lachnospiraceae bacterium]